MCVCVFIFCFWLVRCFLFVFVCVRFLRGKVTLSHYLSYLFPIILKDKTPDTAPRVPLGSLCFSFLGLCERDACQLVIFIAGAAEQNQSMDLLIIDLRLLKFKKKKKNMHFYETIESRVHSLIRRFKKKKKKK